MKGNKTGLKIRENLEEILKEMKCFRAENTNTYVSDNQAKYSETFRSLQPYLIFRSQFEFIFLSIPFFAIF